MFVDLVLFLPPDSISHSTTPNDHLKREKENKKKINFKVFMSILRRMYTKEAETLRKPQAPIIINYTLKNV